MINLNIIGTVKSRFSEAEPADARLMKKEISYIEIKAEYAEGLDQIENSAFIDVIFHFHKSDGWEMKTHTYSGNYKGVFATRSPRRPSSIGVTTVKLIEKKGNVLKVTGLDALDNTPVLDIKVADTYLLQQNLDDIAEKRLKEDPRKDVMALILAGDTERLLLKAGQLHGHYCPGLAMGVMAATFAMNHLKIADSDGLEDIIAITETNNCMSDGVQFVTGCTFGNNAMIFKDIGKTAFSLCRRNGKGIRISTKPGSREYMRKSREEFSLQYAKVVGQKEHSDKTKEKYKLTGLQAALATLQLDFDKIFNVEQTEVRLPDYAPTHDSILCKSCGEPIMESRVVFQDNQNLCLTCAGKVYMQLDGDGLHLSQLS